MGVLLISSQVSRAHFRPGKVIALQKDGAGSWVTRREKGAGPADRVSSCPAGPSARPGSWALWRKHSFLQWHLGALFSQAGKLLELRFSFRGRVEGQGKDMEGVFDHFGLEKS